MIQRHAIYLHHKLLSFPSDSDSFLQKKTSLLLQHFKLTESEAVERGHGRGMEQRILIINRESNTAGCVAYDRYEGDRCGFTDCDQLFELKSFFPKINTQRDSDPRYKGLSAATFYVTLKHFLKDKVSSQKPARLFIVSAGKLAHQFYSPTGASGCYSGC